MFHDDEATGRNKNPSHFTNTTGIMVCRAAHALVMWYALRMLDINNNNNNIFRVQWKPKSCSSNMLKWLVSTTSPRVHSPLPIWSEPNDCPKEIQQKMWNILMVFPVSLFNFGVFEDDAHSVCTLQFILLFPSSGALYVAVSVGFPTLLQLVMISFPFFLFFILRILFSWVAGTVW